MYFCNSSGFPYIYLRFIVGFCDKLKAYYSFIKVNMNKETKELLDKLRYTYADNGAGYNSDFTLTLQKAADLIEVNTEEIEELTYEIQVVEELLYQSKNKEQTSGKSWLIRKEPSTKDTYYVAEGTPPDNVLAVYGIVKGTK